MKIPNKGELQQITTNHNKKHDFGTFESEKDRLLLLRQKEIFNELYGKRFIKRKR